VLSVKLLQGGVVEIAASHMLSPRKYLDFHEYIYANRGVIGAGQVLTAGEEVSLDRNRLAEATAKMSVVDIMRQNAEFGVHAGLIATSAFVIGGVAILVYPGLNPLERIIAAVRACGKVVC
jgi:protein-disulfide isomerase